MNTFKGKRIGHVWPSEWLWKILVLFIFKSYIKLSSLFFSKCTLRDLDYSCITMNILRVFKPRLLWHDTSSVWNDLRGLNERIFLPLFSKNTLISHLDARSFPARFPWKRIAALTRALSSLIKRIILPTPAALGAMNVWLRTSYNLHFNYWRSEDKYRASFVIWRAVGACDAKRISARREFTN